MQLTLGQRTRVELRRARPPAQCGSRARAAGHKSAAGSRGPGMGVRRLGWVGSYSAGKGRSWALSLGLSGPAESTLVKGMTFGLSVKNPPGEGLGADSWGPCSSPAHSPFLHLSLARPDPLPHSGTSFPFSRSPSWSPLFCLHYSIDVYINVFALFSKRLRFLMVTWFNYWLIKINWLNQNKLV